MAHKQVTWKTHVIKHLQNGKNGMKWLSELFTFAKDLSPKNWIKALDKQKMFSINLEETTLATQKLSSGRG